MDMGEQGAEIWDYGGVLMRVLWPIYQGWVNHYLTVNQAKIGHLPLVLICVEIIVVRILVLLL